MTMVFEQLFRFRDRPDRLRKVLLTLFILLSIGLLRTWLEVRLGIFLDKKWFSLDPDILFTMALYPVYLTFFLFFALDRIFHWLKIPYQPAAAAALLFRLQFIHVLIPLFDWIGLRYGISGNFQPFLNSAGMFFGFSLNPFADLENLAMFPIYFTPFILLFTRVTTLGIDVAWLIAGIAFARFLKREVHLGDVKTWLIIFILFQIIYWPIYKYHFVFNWWFHVLFNTKSFSHFGYGSYFLLLGLFGLWFFLKKAPVMERELK